MVDFDDYELAIWKWNAIHYDRISFGTQTWYAVRREGEKRVWMHLEIAERAGLPKCPQYDHWDRNSLNNSRSNLRPCTARQNQWNKGKVKKFGVSTSEYKGVFWHKAVGKWTAAIRVYGKLHHLGYFATQEEAARAYDRAARRFFGEFACVNFT